MSDPFRHRCQVALERARDFVAARGSALERLRLEVLLGARPTSEVVRAVETFQAPDGAFAPPAGAGRGAEAASVAAALTALGILDELGIRRGPVVERGVSWLAGRQAADGSWSTGSGGGEDERVVTTGRVGGLLGKLAAARPAVLEAAADYLASRWSPARVAGGAWEALAAYAVFFSNVAHALADEVLPWCGRELARGYRTQRCDALAVARVLTLCDATRLPGADLGRAELAQGILAGQADDGGFGRGAGPGGRVADTLDAALALVRLDAP